MTNDDSGITRRAMLALLGGGAGAVLVGGTVAWRVLDDDEAGGPDADAPPPDPLPDSEARLDGIAQVGARYRELVPAEADRAALLAAIPMPELLPEAADALEEEIGARRDQIREDFAEGEVVDIDGWQLSRTEARLAALISLSSG